MDDKKILELINAGKTDEEIIEEVEEKSPAEEEKTGWWKITYTIAPNEIDLEHIANEIQKGFTEGQMIHE